MTMKIAPKAYKLSARRFENLQTLQSLSSLQLMANTNKDSPDKPITTNENITDEKKQDNTNNDEIEIELYYQQQLGGKATVIRMCLELAGLQWKEALEGKDDKKDGAHIKGPHISGYPNIAYPIIKYGKNVISQTPVICEYIMNENGFKCKDKMDEYYCRQIVLTVWDIWDEWAFKQNKSMGYDKWITNRVGSFLEVFTQQLKRNKDGKEWYFGDKISVADIFVCDLMRRYKYTKSEHYKQCKYDILKSHCHRVEQYPEIKKYLNSERYKLKCAKNEKFTAI